MSVLSVYFIFHHKSTFIKVFTNLKTVNIKYNSTIMKMLNKLSKYNKLYFVKLVIIRPYP